MGLFDKAKGFVDKAKTAVEGAVSAVKEDAKAKEEAEAARIKAEQEAEAARIQAELEAKRQVCAQQGHDFVPVFNENYIDNIFINIDNKGCRCEKCSRCGEERVGEQVAQLDAEPLPETVSGNIIMELNDNYLDVGTMTVTLDLKESTYMVAAKNVASPTIVRGDVYLRLRYTEEKIDRNEEFPGGYTMVVGGVFLNSGEKVLRVVHENEDQADLPTDLWKKWMETYKTRTRSMFAKVGEPQPYLEVKAICEPL